MPDNYKDRMAAVHPTSDEPYNPSDYNTPLSQVPMDVLKSGVSGLTNTMEGMFGQFGDRFELARLINDYFKGSSGMDLSGGIDKAQQYSAPMPTSQNVSDYVTDPLLEAMGPAAKDFARHEPQTPWGSAADLAAGFADPTDYIPVGKLGKLAKRGL